MEGALRRPWWVGGPFRTWEFFFVLWEMNLFFVSKIPASHWCLGVPPSPLLHSSVLYYRTYCCTAVLLPSIVLAEDVPLLPSYCCSAVLPCYFFVILVLTEDNTAPICFCPPYRPATGILRENHY